MMVRGVLMRTVGVRRALVIRSVWIPHNYVDFVPIIFSWTFKKKNEKLLKVRTVKKSVKSTEQNTLHSHMEYETKRTGK